MKCVVRVWGANGERGEKMGVRKARENTNCCGGNVEAGVGKGKSKSLDQVRNGKGRRTDRAVSLAGRWWLACEWTEK